MGLSVPLDSDYVPGEFDYDADRAYHKKHSVEDYAELRGDAKLSDAERKAYFGSGGITFIQKVFSTLSSDDSATSSVDEPSVHEQPNVEEQQPTRTRRRRKSAMERTLEDAKNFTWK